MLGKATGERTLSVKKQKMEQKKPHAQHLLEFPWESKARQGRQFRTDDPEEFLGALSSRVGLQMPSDFFWDDLGQGSYWLGVSELDQEGVGDTDSRWVDFHMKGMFLVG